MTFRTVAEPYNITEEGRAARIKGAKKTRETRIARDNYRHTEATRAKLSESTSRAIADGKLDRRSNIEKVVEIEMTALGINFVSQYGIRNSRSQFAAVLDFFIPDFSVGIEVNGTFWHSDPRFFPNGPIHEIQKCNATKWRQKIDLCKSLGIDIVEIWEDDIKKDVKNAVLKACASLIR